MGLGETKETTQGTPQTIEQSSGGEKGITSGGGPETFTKEQVEKQVSDRLAATGRDAKSLETRGKDLETREVAINAEQERIAQWQKARDNEELERARDNPELLDIVQQKRALREKEAKFSQDRTEFDRDKAQYQELIDSANATKREIVIWDIAQKNVVDAATLKEKCDKFNLQTQEQMEEMAKTMAGAKTLLKPDSGVTTGSAKDLSGKSPMQLAREAYTK